MPTISVIVPVYKVEKYLNRCVESIIAQTYKDFELILVDDGSPDNCPVICDEWVKKDSRVVVIHKKNGGLSDARNKAIDRARGEYVIFIDSDDWVHPQILEHLYSGVVNDNASISVCGYCETCEENFSFEMVKDCEFTIYDVKKFFEEVFWCKSAIGEIACAKLYKKSLFNNIRFPVGKIHEDTYTTPKVVLKADKIAVTYEKLYYYYQRPDSITHRENASPPFERYESVATVLELFFENGFHGLYARHLPHTLVNQFEGYKKYVETGNKKNAKKVKKIIKKHFKVGRKMLGWTAKDNAYLYEFAYPTLMKYYWIFMSIKNKIKNGVFGRND